MSKPSEAELADFLELAEEELATAIASGEALEQNLRFARLDIALTIAGEALAAQLTAPIAARIKPAAGPLHARIGVWAEPSERVLALPWGEEDVGPMGRVRVDGRFIAVHDLGTGTVTLGDRERARILYRVPSWEQLAWWERAAPLRAPLFWALSGPNLHLVHGGAIGDGARGGVLLGGPGGSGKTTTALAGLEAGLRYVADDYLLLDARAARAWNIYGTAKLDADQLARFPALAREVSDAPPPGQKAHYDIARHRPDALVDSLELRAIVIPRVGGGTSVLRALDRAAALRALAPSSVFQLPFDRGAVVGGLAKVVRRLPCFELAVGDDLAELAAMVGDLLDRVGERTPA
jgi:hypothetical protein